ncbi:MAG: nonstructural protein [Microvirus sp.]|nr:MAG: nonstructural protein [Microvirus sp.]
MKQLYTVYDVVAATIVGSIIQESLDAPAIRAFHDALKAPQSLLAQHPADYQLLLVGLIGYDGEITPAVPPKVIATGAAWAEQDNPPMRLEA